MKIFSGADRKPLDKAAAKACVGINLLATPGLGTIMAGRWLAGTVQLVCAFAGFGLVLGWYYFKFKAILTETSAGHGWMGIWGLVFFVAAWIGALVSSLDMLREAKPKIPPKLDGPNS